MNERARKRMIRRISDIVIQFGVFPVRGGDDEAKASSVDGRNNEMKCPKGEKTFETYSGAVSKPT